METSAAAQGARLVLRNATVLDADGPRPRSTVVVRGRRIESVDSDEASTATTTSEPDDRVVDLASRTVMPGMVSSHFHATYHELGSKLTPFGLEDPPALQAARAAHHLQLALQCGFTGVVSAGAPFAIDAGMKAAIAEGLFPGPRMVAGSRDVSTTGHAGDKSFPWYWDVGARGAINRADGPEGFRRAVREEIKEGAEIIKMFVTGGHGTVAPSERIEMSRAELAAGVEAAHERGARVRGHIANGEAIHMALDVGVDVIDHGDGLDDAAIERMVEAGTFLVPSQLFPVRFSEAMGGGGLGFASGMHADVERSLAILPRANAAGVKLLCGDDYGAIGLPHGCYADELEFYVKEAGIPPIDVLRWATSNGAELLGRGHELGWVRAGYLADLLVVDGDPLTDIGVLRDRGRLLAVMKGGGLVKDELDRLADSGH
ncbi:MAG TPA: amidohydrolase family protein [Acidimicrobiales bacterium]|nr:amidohydrolase family protein [Acidimicrobiales bacterium]